MIVQERMAEANQSSHKSNEERTTAVGLARYAYDYLEAAQLVDDEIGERPGYEIISPIPAYFLAFHAIELTLKAYLRHHGVSARQLRSKTYGHDVHACLRKAKELGLQDIFKIHPNDERALKLLSDLNKDSGLRYIQTGEKDFPTWAIVEPLAVRLHQAVAPHVGYKQTFTATFGGY